MDFDNSYSSWNYRSVSFVFTHESNKFYFDATVIGDDLETALILGRRNNQIAIFDLENMEEIRL